MSKPSLRFLLSHPAHFVACGLGSGLSPVAPGTVGTLFAWATYPLLRLVYPEDGNFALFLGLMAAFGIWCMHIAGRHLGVTDHGAIVWDEIVPFWTVLLFLPAALLPSAHGVGVSWSGVLWQGAGFALFRLFDIYKPSPADYFDREVKNSFGVLMDDVVAAGYTLLVLAVAKQMVVWAS